ncbi:unnamed protein product [Chrysoparadoxa australica]
MTRLRDLLVLGLLAYAHCEQVGHEQQQELQQKSDEEIETAGLLVSDNWSNYILRGVPFMRHLSRRAGGRRPGQGMLDNIRSRIFDGTNEPGSYIVKFAPGCAVKHGGKVDVASQAQDAADMLGETQVWWVYEMLNGANLRGPYLELEAIRRVRCVETVTQDGQCLAGIGGRGVDSIAHEGYNYLNRRLMDEWEELIQDGPGPYANLEEDKIGNWGISWVFCGAQECPPDTPGAIGSTVPPPRVKMVGSGAKRREAVAWVVDTGIDVDNVDLNVNRDLDFNAYSCKKAKPGLEEHCRHYMSGYNVDSVDDDHGHGTLVAHIIGAIKNQSGTVGVAPGLTLAAVKAFSGGLAATDANLLAGLQHIYDNAEAGDAANFSWGNMGWPCSLLEEAVTRITKDKGVLVAAASGNTSKDNSAASPMRLSLVNDRVIGVAAMLRDGSLSHATGYGESVTVSAPGREVLIAYSVPGTPIGKFPPEPGVYVRGHGTSLSVGFVTALLCLHGSGRHGSGLGISNRSASRYIKRPLRGRGSLVSVPYAIFAPPEYEYEYEYARGYEYQHEQGQEGDDYSGDDPEYSVDVDGGDEERQEELAQDSWRYQEMEEEEEEPQRVPEYFRQREGDKYDGDYDEEEPSAARGVHGSTPRSEEVSGDGTLGTGVEPHQIISAAGRSVQLDSASTMWLVAVSWVGIVLAW